MRRGHVVPSESLSKDLGADKNLLVKPALGDGLTERQRLTEELFEHLEKFYVLAKEYSEKIQASPKKRPEDLPRPEYSRVSLSNDIGRLVRSGADINGLSIKSGKALLHLIVELSTDELFYKVTDGFIGDMLSFLVEGLGADINVRNVEGETPLHLAVEHRHEIPHFAEILIRGGADCNAIDNNLETPLHYFFSRTDNFGACKNLPCEKCACRYRDGSSENLFLSENLLRFFITRGTNANARDKDGMTPIHYCFSRFSSARFHFAPYFLKFFLRDGRVDVNAPNNNGDRPIHYLAAWPKFHYYQVRYFLNGGNVIIDIPNNNGETPLHWAVYKDSTQKMKRLLKVVKFFLKEGANPNAANNSGETPFHYAVSARYDLQKPKDLARLLELIKLFLKAGADPNAQNKDGKTPLSYALSRGIVHRDARGLLERKMLKAAASRSAPDASKAAAVNPSSNFFGGVNRTIEAVSVNDVEIAGVTGALGGLNPAALSPKAHEINKARPLPNLVGMLETQRASAVLTEVDANPYPRASAPVMPLNSAYEAARDGGNSSLSAPRLLRPVPFDLEVIAAATERRRAQNSKSCAIL